MFFRRPKKPEEKEVKDIPGKWIKCPKCGQLIYEGQLERNLRVCPYCGYHFRIGIYDYLKFLLDEGAFTEEIGKELEPEDPLNFPGYSEKLEKLNKKYGLKEAAIAGIGQLDGHKVVLFLTDFRFLAGSMGSVYGEKFIRAIKRAVSEKLPFISLVASGGGARMHEGIISLMQMAKTVVGTIMLENERLPFISVLADPTMGGVMASFASLGDIIIAEPGALLGFAGPRVIRDTIKQKLPPDFQTAEFLLKHGMVDIVVQRKDLKKTISRILNMLEGPYYGRSRTQKSY